MNSIIIKNKFDKKSLILVLILIVLVWVSQQTGNHNIKQQVIPTFFFQIAIYLFLLVAFYNILQTFVGYTLFKKIDGYLIIEKKCIITYSKRRYQVDMISNITLIRDAQSQTYWGFQGARFHESKKVLSFSFNKKNVIIDVDIADDTFAKLKKLIN